MAEINKRYICPWDEFQNSDGHAQCVVLRHELFDESGRPWRNPVVKVWYDNGETMLVWESDLVEVPDDSGA